jgi:hypothetical protein
VTQSQLGTLGSGDMTKAIYDANQNGIVDNAEKVNGFTVEKAVPADAEFTDTTYSDATTLVSGLMSATDKAKVNDVSGVNSGDETASSIKTKLEITTLSGSNTGDQTIPTKLSELENDIGAGGGATILNQNRILSMGGML